MLACIQKEGSAAKGGMVAVVDSIFNKRQIPIPIDLISTYIMPEHVFHNSVNTFSVTIRLRVES